MSEEIDLEFDIIPFVDEDEKEVTAIRHCSWHQPATDPRVRAAIEFYHSNFKIKYVTSGICAECLAVLNKEFDDEEN